MKKIKSALVAITLLTPIAANAAGGVQIGTAPLLLGLGVTNIYGQFPLGGSSAVVATYSTINGSFSGGTLNATLYSAAYKSYFSNYGKGGYWEVGAAQADVQASTVSTLTASGTIPILVGGYEWKLGGAVLGVEGGIGTGGGWGVLGVNAAYEF